MDYRRMVHCRDKGLRWVREESRFVEGGGPSPKDNLGKKERSTKHVTLGVVPGIHTINSKGIGNFS